MGNKHIVWLDNAKLLAMFFVLYDHHGLENKFAGDWIWTFHLAVFFLIAGIFARSDESFLIMMKKNAKRLLLPVFLWYAIGAFLWQPLLIYMTSPNEFWENLKSAHIDFLIGRSCGFGWFMICLFWMKCEFWALIRWSSKILYLCGFLLFPIASYMLSCWGFIPYYINNSFMAFPFYLLGYTFRTEIRTLNINTLVSGIVAVLSLLLSLTLCIYAGKYSLNALDFGAYPPVIYLQGFIGSFFVISLCYTVKLDRQWLRILGGGTIVILLFQPPFLLAAKVVYRLLFNPSHPAPYFDLASAFVSSVIIMLLMVPAIKFINRYAPKLNGK